MQIRAFCFSEPALSDLNHGWTRIHTDKDLYANYANFARTQPVVRVGAVSKELKSPT
jgi:hypothetical protein